MNATTTPVISSPVRTMELGRVNRLVVAGARTDRLYFAQVREDPELELDALAPALGGTIVAVGSGGCTALSLLARGTGSVIAVDLNSAQSNLIELKAVAISILGRERALGFLGGAPALPAVRVAIYTQLRSGLCQAARSYWDARLDAIRGGVLGAGVSERLIRTVVRALGFAGHGRRRMLRLLACRTLDEQRRIYAREWRTTAWRMLLRFLLSRRRLTGVYDRRFFHRVDDDAFGDRFVARIEHGLTALPAATNYFLHHMVTGQYPEGRDEALPPYLTADGAAAVGARRDRLTLVDGGLTEYLRTRADSSIDGFVLSNICEWLDPWSIEALFAEVVRTAVPGAVVCLRNFLGFTEVPSAWTHAIVEDRTRGELMIARDRSLLQRRFVPSMVRKEMK